MNIVVDGVVFNLNLRVSTEQRTPGLPTPGGAAALGSRGVGLPALPDGERPAAWRR